MKALRMLVCQLTVLAVLLATCHGLASTAGHAEATELQGHILTRPTGAAQSEKLRSAVTAPDAPTQLSKLKHRWNFASLDCAAVVHRTNPAAKFASAILSEKKDRYMLSPCPRKGGKTLETSQFVIVELCEEIKIDTIVLANYEFFSSMFKSFKVTAARQLTGREDDWTELGSFRARNVRGIQVFRIPSASRSDGFFRYVRIDFLEHFGSEYYCPVSLLRVYGLTQMEEFSRELGELDSETEDAESLQQASVPAIDAPAPEAASVEHKADQPNRESLSSPNESVLHEIMASDEDVWSRHEQLFQQKIHNETLAAGLKEANPPIETVDEHSLPIRESPNNGSMPHSTEVRSVPPETQAVAAALNGTCPANFTVSASERNKTVCRQAKHDLKSLFAPEAIRRRAQQALSEELSLPGIAARANETNAMRLAEHNARRNGGQHKGNNHQAAAGTESVYRAIHRRLSALEANATLSLSYIEHSGLMLREVFARMERRQEGRMSVMLEALNSTNWKQIESLKRGQHVDLQRAIFEFDVHRQQAETERLALLREVHLLAGEVLLEKRLSIAQLVLLLAVFIFVGMTRGSRTVPLIHSGIAKISGSSRTKKPAPFDDLLAHLEPNSAARGAQSVLKSPNMPTNGKSISHSRTSDLPAENRPALSPITLNSPVRTRHAPVEAKSMGKKASVLGSSPMPTTPTASRTNGHSKSSKSRSRTDPLLNLLMDKGLKGRLAALLNTLELLEKDPNVGSRSKSSSVPRSRTVAAHTSEPPIRAVRAQKLTEPQTVGSQTSTHRHMQTQDERKIRDDHGEHVDVGDDKGMSSDWTEKSENEDASEAGALFSDDDDDKLDSTKAAKAEDKMRRAHAELQIGGPSPALLSASNFSSHTLKSPMDPLKTHAVATGLLPAMSLPTGSGLSEAQAYASDSDSDGGAWQRVLPRRMLNGPNGRRPRTRSNEAKRPKLIFDTDRSSAPPEGVEMSSHRRSSLHGRNSKPQTPDSLRRFWMRAPSSPIPESQRRRSETPDTIRGINN